MGTLSKETGAVAGISQRQERYTRSAPAFLIILAALVLLLGFSMVLSVCTGIAGGSFKVFAETVFIKTVACGAVPEAASIGGDFVCQHKVGL